MKALITGGRGFAGSYLKKELIEHGYTLVDMDCGGKPLDLLQKEDLNRLLCDRKPDYIYHLAGQASVPLSWKDPYHTFESNVGATLNLLEGVAQHCPSAKILLVGSSDQYGNLKERGELVSENIPLQPQTPYAISKRAQEELGILYHKTKGLSIYLTRSFNHAGAGQRIGFMISDFASGITKIEKGEESYLSVGNLEAKRDFTHVSDIVRAYRLILERGSVGEIYNVGSGTVHSAQEILEKLIFLSSAKIEVRQDPDKMRPSDTPVIRCDNRKLNQDTGWEPCVPLDEILQETLEFFRK